MIYRFNVLLKKMNALYIFRLSSLGKENTNWSKFKSGKKGKRWPRWNGFTEMEK